MLLILSGMLLLLFPAFFSGQNVRNLLRQLTPLFLIALGMLLIVLTGGIDFSAGAVEAFGGMMISVLIAYGNLSSVQGACFAVFLTLLCGAILGACNGLLIGYLKMEPFIITIAMMSVARGLTYLLSQGQSVRVSALSQAGRALLLFGRAETPLFRIPYVVLTAIICAVLLSFLQKYSRCGRLLAACGADEQAVRFAGIHASRYKCLAYMLAGTLYAAAGIVVTARTCTGTPGIGSSIELDAITAIILGGVSLSGGSGTVFGTICGTLIWGLSQNAMNLFAFSPYVQQVMKGSIIILAVWLQRVSRHDHLK